MSAVDHLRRARHAAAQRRYAQTPAFRVVDAARRERDKRAGKIAARSAVRKAILRGELVPQPCRFASRECSAIVHAHHTHGYRRAAWLRVEWVCAWHHCQAERNRREMRSAA